VRLVYCPPPVEAGVSHTEIYRFLLLYYENHLLGTVLAITHIIIISGVHEKKLLAIRLDKNNFSGINELVLESFSLVDGHLLKTDKARYIIKGEKISGENIIE
jgi:hypothetical protein